MAQNCDHGGSLIFVGLETSFKLWGGKNFEIILLDLPTLDASHRQDGHYIYICTMDLYVLFERSLLSIILVFIKVIFPPKAIPEIQKNQKHQKKMASFFF